MGLENTFGAGLDQSTHALEIIDYEHHEIHSGSHFTVVDSVAVDTTTQNTPRNLSFKELFTYNNE